MPDSAEKLRADLAKIGERRRAQARETRELARETRRAVRRSKGVISMVEVARLVGLDRTSLYQTYGR